MNRRILRLAIPNIISNITIPLLGLVDTAIAGRLGGGEVPIAALAIGTAIFNMIYWLCGFIRMGTSGITAQAYGARDFRETGNILVRSMAVSITIGVILVVLRNPIGRLSLGLMEGSPESMAMAADYFYARIWAAPASVSLFSIHGWFIGMQDSKSPMVVAIFSNILNVIFSLVFVYRFEMGLAGIAWGTVVAQYGGVALSWTLWYIYYHRFGKYVSIRESLRLAPMFRFFNINKDIFLRSLCNVATYTFFTVASSRFDDTILATNALLMQLFTLYSYMADGFAYAAESLTGRFIGARNQPALRDAVRKLLWWSIGISAAYVLVYVGGWRGILGIFNPTDAIMETARSYVGWVIAVPLLCSVPFLIDGIMLGATQTRVLLNTIFIAAVLYFGTYYALVGLLGNTALWLAFVIYIAARGVGLWLATGGLDTARLMKGRAGN